MLVLVDVGAGGITTASALGVRVGTRKEEGGIAKRVRFSARGAVD